MSFSVLWSGSGKPAIKTRFCQLGRLIGALANLKASIELPNRTEVYSFRQFSENPEFLCRIVAQFVGKMAKKSGKTGRTPVGVDSKEEKPC